MARTYEAKDGNIYLALSNIEKRHIYRMGEVVIRDVAERTKNGDLPSRWNEYDINSLEIPLLCEPIETGGKFIDLMLQQIDKYNKALNKLYGCTFNDLYDIEIEDGKLTKEEVYQRMEDYRDLKRKVQQKKLIERKEDIISQSGLFY